MSFDFLKDMSAADRRELAAQLALEMRSTKVEFTSAELELWDAIGDTLSLGRSRQSLSAFASDFGRKKYAGCVEAVEVLLGAAVPSNTRKPVVMSVRRVMLRCLAEYLASARTPVTPRVMLSNLGVLRWAVDQQYPGYIEAQLLHRVAQVLAA